jgi:transcription antitermination factor NusA-like protein
LKSGILCSKCRKRLEKGEVSQTDLEISRLIMSLEEEYPPLQEIFFHRAIEADGVLAIVVGKGDVAKILSYGGKIIKILGNKMKKTIRIIEQNSDERKFLEDLFAPIDIITINKIWLPDGTMETRVILKGRGRRRSSINTNAMKEISRKVFGTILRVEFAR